MSKLIRSSPSKSCDLDPCPAQIVKDSADILAGSITMIINFSLAEVKFPDTFKIAYVTPLFKKYSLDRRELSNFRPVSGLKFVSKLIEKMVASQKNRTCKIQLFRITFNQHINVEIQPKRPFCKFKMIFVSSRPWWTYCSFALGFVCGFWHDRSWPLAHRLTEWFGIDGVVLQWVRFYLTGRSQLVNGVLSTPQLCGVSKVYYSSQFNNNSFWS